MRHGINVHAASQDEQQDADNRIPGVETLLFNESAVPDCLEDPRPGHSSFPEMSMENWHQLQREDVALAQVINILETESDPETLDKRSEEPEVALLLRERSKLLLVDGVLHRKVLNQRGEAFHQLVMPNSHRERAFKGVHDKVGHMGIERTSQSKVLLAEDGKIY